jgi:serine/threonine-protein kinase
MLAVSSEHKLMKMTHLKPGSVLRNRYHIVGLIGSGGMGAVYLADDQRLKGRRCAIKEQVLIDTTLAVAVQKQFEQEASILAQLDHPGLPKVSDYFSDDSGVRDYLVMDHVPGPNLEQLITEAQRNKTYLEEETVLQWVDQLCDILIYLHSRSPMVLHRDIKPANIKLTPDSRLKLVDFGLAKPFDPDDPRTITGLQGLGSLPYTPIEQYLGHMGHTDARSDLYALGATCYHLFTGRPPLSANDYFLHPEKLISPQVINPSVSAHTGEMVLWAMRLHPNDRATSIATWHAGLRQAETDGLFNAVDTAEAYDTSIIGSVFRDNIALFGIAGLLLILALVITFA